MSTLHVSWFEKMTKILLISCFLLLNHWLGESLSFTGIQDSLKKNKERPDSSKITVDGSDVKIAGKNAHKYLVSIRHLHDLNSHIGSGSLFYGGQWIITTRSNLARVDESGIHEAYKLAIFPKWNSNISEITTKKYKYWEAAKTFCHPFMRYSNKHYEDIGLIKLYDPIPVVRHGDPTKFHAIELIEDDFKFADKTEALVARWGVIDTASNNPPMSGPLREVYMPIFSPSDASEPCRSELDLYARSVILCGYKENVAMCTGDQGGPVSVYTYEHVPDRRNELRRAFLAGIITVKDKCRGTSYFLNVTHFRHFIDYVRRVEPARYRCRNMIRRK